MRAALTRLMVVGLCSCFAAVAAEAGVVVWLDGPLPEAKLLERADVKTGGTQHVGSSALRFPPAPVTSADDARYEALRKTIADSKKRWNDFEVEYGIAVQVDDLLSSISVIRSERDLDDLVGARLFQGSAVHVSFKPGALATDPRGELFRFDLGVSSVNKPWAQALALQPDRTLVASDTVDGAAFPALQAESQRIAELDAASLTVIETGTVVNGRPVEPGPSPLSLAPGRHYVHVVRDGIIAGRAVLDLPPGGAATQPSAVADASLRKAREQVLQGTTTGFPDDVKRALGEIARHFGNDQIFVGAIDGSRLEVLPYSHGAELLAQRPLTFVSAGELGGGAMISSIFANAGGDQVTAPMASGSVSFEVGIYNAAILFGTDLMFHPGQPIAHGLKSEDGTVTENVYTSVSAQPWGGLGAYLLRPTGARPTLLIAGTYGWVHPAHMSVGARLSLGVPLGGEDDTWFRMTIGGSTAGSSRWDTGSEKEPLHQAFLRGGFAKRF